MSKRQGEEGAASVRPALAKLSSDVQAQVRDLERGLDGEADVVKWLQRLTIRTLGEIGNEFYREAARSLMLRGTLFRALVDDPDLDGAEELRTRVAGKIVLPAHHRALRNLRKGAGEYLDDAESSDAAHRPAKQRFIAMRPAVDELDTYQQRVLARIGACYPGLDVDKVESRSDLLDWIVDLELATHGEFPAEVAERFVLERSTSAVLTSPDLKRTTRVLAARVLLPAFNDGIRDLAGRSGEQPDDKTPPSEVSLA